MMKVSTPAHLTIQAQANGAADIVRRAQSQAMAQGQRLKVTASATKVCVDPYNAIVPCSGVDVFTAGQGVTVGTSATLHFNSLGQPVDSVGTLLATDSAFNLTHTSGGQTSTFTITVAALSGRVSVSP